MQGSKHEEVKCGRMDMLSGDAFVISFQAGGVSTTS
jgi:hypothetical protein